MKEGKPPGFGFPCAQYSTNFDTEQELSDILPEILRHFKIIRQQEDNYDYQNHLI